MTQSPSVTRISSVPGNRQRLDGGAMFGNAPRALWAKLCPPDDENRISLSCRALLVERGDQRVLFETGIGLFFAPALRQRFGVFEDDHVLLTSLAALGLSDADITHVVLSHLHFDHAGGLLSPYEAGQPLRLLFPRARFVVSQAALERAEHPHARDRASFIPELPGLLRQSGRLHVIPERRSEDASLPGLRFHYSDGHTPGLMLTEVLGAPSAADDDVGNGAGSLTFLGDLVPGSAWVHLPMTMGYDRFPELLIDEKTALLGSLLQRRGRLFFTHDLDVAMATLEQRADGRFIATQPVRDADLVRRPL